jgi:hypothetical protein
VLSDLDLFPHVVAVEELPGERHGVHRAVEGMQPLRRDQQALTGAEEKTHAVIALTRQEVARLQTQRTQGLERGGMIGREVWIGWVCIPVLSLLWLYLALRLD